MKLRRGEVAAFWMERPWTIDRRLDVMAALEAMYGPLLWADRPVPGGKWFVLSRDERRQS